MSDLSQNELEKRYGFFPGDSQSESEVKTIATPLYAKKIQAIVDAQLVDPTTCIRGLDYMCGYGAVTAAALQVLPNIIVTGVDIDPRGYSFLTPEERARTIFVHEAIERFMAQNPDPFDIVLAGYIWAPDGLDYQTLGSIVKPGGIVAELLDSPKKRKPWGGGNTFETSKMEGNGFQVVNVDLHGDGRVWRKS